MKKIIFILFVFIMHKNSFGQVNLVPNPSFETYSSCPTYVSQLYRAIPWYNPNSNTPDYFNVCGYDSTATGVNPGVPNNFWGYQSARTGNAYANIGTDTYSNEYVAVKLDSALKANTKYCVEFYLSLTNTAKYSISSVGAYFSINPITDYSTITNLPVTPQVQNPSNRFLSDTVNWMKVSGEFIASGGEQYLTIGNFTEMANMVLDTTYPSNLGNIMYYYLDDVSVFACSDPVNPEEPLYIPTVLSGNQSFEIKGLQPNTKLLLYNSLGQMVYSNSNYTNEMNSFSFQTGIYYYYVKFENGDLYKGKLFILN